MEWMLAPPGDIPSPPASSAHKFRIDVKERVVRADFSSSSASSRIDPLDEAYVLRLFERPDVTVIIKGLATGLDPDLWNTRFLAERCGEIMYHSFRRFVLPPDADGDGNPEGAFAPVPEREKAWSSMRLRDFVRYLDRRANALRTRAAAAGAATTGDTSAAAATAAAAAATSVHGAGDIGAQERSPAGSDISSSGSGGNGGGGGGEDRRQRGGDVTKGEREAEVGAPHEEDGGGQDEAGEQPSMQFASYDGSRRTVELLRESVYLTDMDLTRYLPECANDLVREFKMDILPAGARCAMQHMPRESRPFLGPNLYITPPGSWTQFHQDGNGTVDSGHQCLAGRNRVIMLRRLDHEKDKHAALRILSAEGSGQGKGGDAGAGGGSKITINGNGVASAELVAGGGAKTTSPHHRRRSSKEQNGGGPASERVVGAGAETEAEAGISESPLYRPPHSDGATPPWPSDEAVERLRELNFCPSVFTLEPGEFVHINKGRLHAFRKERPLPGEDPGSVCVSVAWDWVFQGVTQEGCKEELGCALRCADDNRRAEVNSLAPVETCLLQMAKASLARHRVRSLRQGLPGPCPGVPNQPPLLAAALPPPSLSPAAAVGAAGDSPPVAAPAATTTPATPAGAPGGGPAENEKLGGGDGGEGEGEGTAAASAAAAAAAAADIDPPVKPAGLGSAAAAGEGKAGSPSPPLSCPSNGTRADQAQGQDNNGKPSPSPAAWRRKHEHHPPPPPPQSRHAANLELISRLTALVPEGALGPRLTDALRAINNPPPRSPPPLPRDSTTGNGSSGGAGSPSGGSCGGSTSASAAEANGGGGAGGGGLAAMEVDAEDEEIRRGALPKMRGAKGGKKNGEGVATATSTATSAAAAAGSGKSSESTSSPSTSTPPTRSSSSCGADRAPGSGSPQQPGPAGGGADAAAAAIIVAPSGPTDDDAHLATTGKLDAPVAAATTTSPPPLTGLDSWITSPRGFDPSALEAAVAAGASGVGTGLFGGAALTDADLTALVSASAKETLETTAPATAASEAAAAREGEGPASVAFAAVAARSAVTSARLAAAVASAAMRRVTESLRGGGSGVDCGGDAAAAAGLGASGGDLGALVALAPMLEELTDRQRKGYGLQVASAKRAERGAKVHPQRPGTRKLGTAAAKARDSQAAALMAKMVRPLKKAVERVEVDTSVPSFKEKINPFSSDGESFNCASCKVEIFNAYMHCYGCETILHRDLTLCLGCHATGNFAFPPDPPDARLLSDRIHCPGEPERTLEQRERKSRSQRSHGVFPASRCECREPSCRQCHLCVACACDCHERYQLRFRFEHPSSLESFVKKVRVAAGGATTISQEAPINSTAAGTVGAAAAAAAAAGREDEDGGEDENGYGDGYGEGNGDGDRGASLIEDSSTGAASPRGGGGSGANNRRDDELPKNDLHHRERQIYQRRAEPSEAAGAAAVAVEASRGDAKKALGGRPPSSRKRKATEKASASIGARGERGWDRSRLSGHHSGDGGKYSRHRGGGGGAGGGGRAGPRSAPPPPADGDDAAAATRASTFAATVSAKAQAPPPSGLGGGPDKNTGDGDGDGNGNSDANGDAGAPSPPPPKKRRETPSNGMGPTAVRAGGPEESAAAPPATVALESSATVAGGGDGGSRDDGEGAMVEYHEEEADAPDWDGEDDADTVLL